MATGNSQDILPNDNFLGPANQNNSIKSFDSKVSEASDTESKIQEDWNLLPIQIGNDLPLVMESYDKILQKFELMNISKTITKCFRFVHHHANNGVAYTHELFLDESKEYKISFCGKVECKKCSNYRPHHRYLNICSNCSNDSSLAKSSFKVIVTNIGKDASMEVTIGIEKYHFEVSQIVHKNETLYHDKYWQELWEFDDKSSIDFPNGDYFSADGNIVIICQITLSLSKTDQALPNRNGDKDFEGMIKYAGQLSVSRLLQQITTVNLLADHFSDANINPVESEEELGDITLVVENTRILCHKFVLSMTCTTFKTMFCTNMKEKDCSEITIHDHNFVTIKTMLRYMYGKTVPDADLTPELLTAADYFGYKHLSEIVICKLLKNISYDNVTNIWRTAYLTNSENLCHTATAFMAKNWNRLLEDKNVQDLVAEYPKLVLVVSKLLSECQYRTRTMYDTESKITKVE